MSREDIVAVAARLFSIYLAIQVFHLASSLMQVVLLENTEYKRATTLVEVAVWGLPTLACAALLWFFPLTIARKLLPVMSDSGSSIPGDRHLIEEVGLTLLGFWVLATAIPDAIFWVALRFFLANGETMPPAFTDDQVANVVATVAQVVLGLALLFGARGLLGVIRRMRTGGN